MGRPSQDAAPSNEPVIDAAFALRWLPRLMFATEPSPLAADFYAAVCSVDGATPEESLARTWAVVDAFGLREQAERHLERRRRETAKLTWRSNERHDERTSL